MVAARLREASRETGREPGYERPVDLGRNPADIAADAWEFRQVKALRARRVPWAHVARQVGKCETSLKEIYGPALGEGPDPTLTRTPIAFAPQPATAAPPPRPREIGQAECLAKVEDRPGVSTTMLAADLGAPRAIANRLLGALKLRGWVRNLACERGFDRACWVTTPAGRAALARAEDGE